MPIMTTLEFTKRDGLVSTKTVRKEGEVPAVFYGPKEGTQSISVDEIKFMKVYEEAGESSVVTLRGDGAEHEVLIHDIQFDPIKGRPLHIDFYVIEKGKKVTVHVPLEFEGSAPAEKTLGGVLVKVLHELEIEAMPKDLPHELVVDISSLVDFDSVIHAKDIKLPSGVTLISDEEETIALVQAPKEEEEEVSVAPDLSTIEVEAKGKKEEVVEEAGK